MNVSLLQTGACSNKLHNGLFLLLGSAPTPASTSTDIDDTFTNKPETEIKSNNDKCLFDVLVSRSGQAKKGKTKRQIKLKDDLSEFYTPSSKKRRTNI